MVRHAQFLILSQGCALAEPAGPWHLTYWITLPNTKFVFGIFNIGKTNFPLKKNSNAIIWVSYLSC